MASFFNAFRGTTVKSASAGGVIHTNASNRYAFVTITASSNPNGSVNVGSLGIRALVGNTVFVGPGESLSAVSTNVTAVVREFSTSNIE